MKILGIETSCDETAAAIVEDGKTILSNVVASSADMHVKYGGIVPEVAARKQLESMQPVLDEAMRGFSPKDIDAIAVTQGPGLIGSLLVGVETAKSFAYTWNKSIIPVNHVIAHIYASFLEKNPPRFPAIALVVSGGHTELYLMQNEKHLRWLGGTLDDAAGECFDKCARLLGLPYPGGPQIATQAEKFISKISSLIKLPRPMINDDSLNFSFSGLKTAVMREWHKQISGKNMGNRVSDLISEFSHEIQESITDVLVAKTLKAVNEYKCKSIIVSGGVAANKRLSHKIRVKATDNAFHPTIHIPSPNLCVDSAAYIAACAFYNFRPVDYKMIEAQPNLSVEV